MLNTQARTPWANNLFYFLINFPVCFRQKSSTSILGNDHWRHTQGIFPPESQSSLDLTISLFDIGKFHYQERCIYERSIHNDANSFESERNNSISSEPRSVKMQAAQSPNIEVPKQFPMMTIMRLIQKLSFVNTSSVTIMTQCSLSSEEKV